MRNYNSLVESVLHTDHVKRIVVCQMAGHISYYRFSYEMKIEYLKTLIRIKVVKSIVTIVSIKWRTQSCLNHYS
jgi:hypothetical protein